MNTIRLFNKYNINEHATRRRC